MFVASLVAMFAMAPLLNDRLGDFWSLAAHLPIWVVLYLLILVVRLRKEKPDD